MALVSVACPLERAARHSAESARGLHHGDVPLPRVIATPAAPATPSWHCVAGCGAGIALGLGAAQRARPRCQRQSMENQIEMEEELTNGDYCTVALGEPEDQWAQVSPDANKRLRDTFLAVVSYILPVVGPALAFWQWSNVLQLTHVVLGDERQLLELMQVTLTPATNGIVIASLSIAFGTLTSLTISSLRQRQKEIRQCLNKEACDIRLLQALFVSMFRLNVEDSCRSSCSEADVEKMTVYLRCLELLHMYAARIHSESTADADLAALQRQTVPDTELLSILNSLVVLRQPPRFSVMSVRDDVAVRVSRLNDFRSDRLSSINTAFPPLHWVILALLASSITLCFLIEVDQSEGRFLAERPEDSTRLRLVFTIMTGSFCGLTALCADLNDLFRGSFNVNESASQLKVVGEVIQLENRQIIQGFQAWSRQRVPEKTRTNLNF